MNQDIVLRLTGKQHELLKRHLLPGDGLEAVAIALCGRRHDVSRHCLSVSKVVLIPHDECQRFPDRVTWKTDRLVPLLEEAGRTGAAVVKFHSHPGGFDRFSEVDTVADRELFSTVSAWLECDRIHASVVILPDGRLFGRVVRAGEPFGPLDLISVAGDSIHFWFGQSSDFIPEFTDRHAQVLGEETVAVLRRLRCAVIGCSGTGSPTIEQLYRLGVGEIVMVDPELVGIENLNRIINSQMGDADNRRGKVDVQHRAIDTADLGTTGIPLAQDLCLSDTIKRVAECDVLFGCVDNVFARHVLNKIASTYCIPYIDIGVRLVADGRGGIEHVTGAVHYLQPDGSSLLSRGVYSLDDLSSAALLHFDPSEHERRQAEGYIAGAVVSRPAVISVNMIFSGLGVFELLSRIHLLRDEPNVRFAYQRISLSHAFTDGGEDGERCMAVTRNLGCGDMRPLLGMPEFSESVRNRA